MSTKIPVIIRAAIYALGGLATIVFTVATMVDMHEVANVAGMVAAVLGLIGSPTALSNLNKPPSGLSDHEAVLANQSAAAMVSTAINQLQEVLRQPVGEDVTVGAQLPQYELPTTG